MNTVADYCEFTIVRRLIPEENLESVRENIIKVLEDVSKETKTNYEYDEFYAIDTMISNPNDKLLSEEIKTIRGKVPDLSPGTFDIIREGIPSINYGPGRIEQAHATDEYVELKDFYDSIKVLALTLYELGTFLNLTLLN
ncbi:MAG: peptidase dimerization domain-containing protein [Saccharolobus sp.]